MQVIVQKGFRRPTMARSCGLSVIGYNRWYTNQAGCSAEPYFLKEKKMKNLICLFVLLFSCISRHCIEIREFGLMEITSDNKSIIYIDTIKNNLGGVKKRIIYKRNCE